MGVAVLDRVPVLYVVLDGERATLDLTRDVLELTVDEHVRKATKITLRVYDPEHVHRARLIPGTQLAVRWGYIGELSAPRGGIIHKAEPDYAEGVLRVEAYGRELALSRGPIRATFRGNTLRDAVQTIAARAGLRVQWDAQDTIRFDGLVVDDETAWSWIQRRTAELGLETLVEASLNGGADIIVVREPPFDRDAAHLLTWRWRNANVLSFEVKEDHKRGEKEDEGVVAVFHDPASGQTLSHAAGDPNTTRRTLAARRLAARHAHSGTSGNPGADNAAVAAYVRTHPELAAETPDAQRAAWQASVARERGGANAGRATEDQPSLLQVLLDTGEVRDGGSGGSGGSGGGTGAVGSNAARGSADGTDAGRLTATPVAAPAAAARTHVRRVAEGSFRGHERAKVKAKVTTVGIPRAKRGDVARVLGVEDRDAGLWYAAGVRHTIGDGYTTEWEFTRDGVNGGRGTRHGHSGSGGSAATQNNAAGAGTNSGAASGTTGAAGREPTRTVNLDTER